MCNNPLVCKPKTCNLNGHIRRQTVMKAVIVVSCVNIKIRCLCKIVKLGMIIKVIERKMYRVMFLANTEWFIVYDWFNFGVYAIELTSG